MLSCNVLSDRTCAVVRAANWSVLRLFICVVAIALMVADPIAAMSVASNDCKLSILRLLSCGAVMDLTWFAVRALS